VAGFLTILFQFLLLRGEYERQIFLKKLETNCTNPHFARKIVSKFNVEILENRMQNF